MCARNLLMYVLFIGVVSTGCDVAEHSGNGAMFPESAVAHNREVLPLIQTPEEALRQLLEGNARFFHGEAGMQLFAKDREVKPFAAIVTLCSPPFAAEDVFDQPRGSLPVLSWTEEKEVLAKLERLVADGVKAVVVLSHDGCTEATAESAVTVGRAARSHQVMDIAAALQMASPSVSASVRSGRCRFLGAVFHSDTKRIHIAGQEIFH